MKKGILSFKVKMLSSNTGNVHFLQLCFASEGKKYILELKQWY